MHVFLIADDSEPKHMFLEALVKESGIASEILIANTTERAKELIDAHKIRAAFIDYEMPTEQGPAVIAYLREKMPTAKIAMVSSSNSERYRTDAFDAGADAYICSSFDQDEVVENIESVLLEWKTELNS